ncbi:2-dehydropantoate 2-reductase (Ketopantoate reductase) (KPA reductase) (KPR) [Dipsacomyces acuminosporus]|nr:2-dehydropantoate 2-reductase (Ketopantoate reductase) (KPA reductase) (KPR) [Dipsacomyces acuminosporus]
MGSSSSSNDQELAPWFSDECQTEVPDNQGGVQDGEQIKRLIITTKAQDTLAAYWSIKDRLDAQSTVVLLQNGMGTYEAIHKEFYSSPQQHNRGITARIPSFVIGTNSHGCLRISNEPFAMHHTAMGSCIFAVRPSLLNPTPPLPTSTLDMLTALGSLPLDVGVVNWSELHLQLLLKLAANATINPVTALTDSRNGYLAPPLPGSPQCTSSDYPDAMYSYLSSACAEIAAIYARAHPHLHTELTQQAVEEYVMHIARTTARNRSSMLQDISACTRTEVDWINGYLVRLGQQHGVPTPVNTLLYTLIKLKEAAGSHAAYGYQ